MKVVVHCIDRHGAVDLRLKNYDAHKAYLAQGKVKTVISGPLLAPDVETMIGSLFVFEAPGVGDVEAFNAGDPFNKAGVWAEVRIHPFNLRVDNRN